MNTHFKMNKIDQCRKGMCQEEWLIYIDQLKLLDQTVQAELQSIHVSAENNHEEQDHILDQKKLILDQSTKWEIVKSDITGMGDNSSVLFELTRFSLSDFYKVRSHCYFSKSILNIYSK